MIPTAEEGAVDVFDAKRGWALGLVLALGAAAAGCGADGGSTGPDVVAVRVEPAATLAVGVGDTVRFTAKVVDGVGVQVTGASVTWRSANAAVATVDGQGRTVSVAAGTTTVTATSGGVSGTASLEVWAPATVTVYQPGTSYFGRQSYVEYIPGELPFILSAPHGGSLTPSEIPDRTSGTTVTDTNSRETLLAVREALIVRTGKAPHVVISHLKRIKLDPNREIVEAAAGNPFAENAWNEFHAYLEVASAAVTKTYRSGFYADIHGHGHAIARAELGYMLSATQLNRTDAEINAPGVAAQSSIRALAASSPLPFAQLLRGSMSLGGLMQKEGVRSVPSPGDPSPGSDEYFTGGYNTERHGSLAAGRTVSGVQIELPLPGIRDTAANRQAFGEALARALEAYMTEHFGFFRTPK
ncbi:MAG TPA: Ig-like domain-containing protein [Longimicrobiales bacterium]|nr:Ig-like domain-containing protein [Longimicrobiales bacterium]